jgi:hypothetical protein
MPMADPPLGLVDGQLARAVFRLHAQEPGRTPHPLRETPWPQRRQSYPFRQWAGEARACPSRTAQVGGYLREGVRPRANRTRIEAHCASITGMIRHYAAGGQ